MRIRHPLTYAARASGSIASAVTAALAVGASLPAHAQQAGASSGIEEIVVTAQRREENLQDVGIAVTALGGELLTNLNITTATDITRAVPSLKMNAYSSSQVCINIRGTRRTTTATSRNLLSRSTRTTATRARSTSRASRSSTSRASKCCAGRRAPCSAVTRRVAPSSSCRTSRPRTSATPRPPWAATSQFLVEGALSGPLTDNVQARIAAISNTDDGYMESVVAGVPDRGGNDHYAVRGQLAWQPSRRPPSTCSCAT